MSVDSFFTAQSAPISGVNTVKNSTTQNGGQPLQGLAFFDLFLNTLEQAIDQNTPVQNSTEQQTSTEDTLLQALANSEYTLEELSKLDDPTITDVLALNQQIDDESLLQIKLPGTQGVSSVLESLTITTEADFRPALHNIQRILQKINDLLAQENPALINLNLDAQQISDLQKRVDTLLNGDADGQDIDGEEFAGVFAGLIKILPPQARPDVVVTGQSIVFSDNAISSSAGQNGAANDGSSRMNPLLQSEDLEAELSDGDIDGSVEGLLKKMSRNSHDLKLGAQGKLDNNAAPKTLPDLSFLQNWHQAGSLLSDGELPPALMEELGLSLSSFSATTQGGLTALVTQGHHAALPHPGTQMVAATLQKAAGGGENSNITLQLDPPELGRVEVKMSFGKDSKIKAVMTVEKPETMLMLQRDSQILERALQDAGLDSEGGLSFEMADQDHSFGQDGSHDGSRNESGSPEDGESELEEFIESTMTWMVDPETGHMHYNIYA